MEGERLADQSGGSNLRQKPMECRCCFPCVQGETTASAPGETRTHNRGIRSALLYPIELRGLVQNRTDAIINSAAAQLGEDLGRLAANARRQLARGQRLIAVHQKDAKGQLG